VLLSELNDLEVARVSGSWSGAEDAALLKSAPHRMAESVTFWSTLAVFIPRLASRSSEECETQIGVLTKADAAGASYSGEPEVLYNCKKLKRTQGPACVRQIAQRRL